MTKWGHFLTGLGLKNRKTVDFMPYGDPWVCDTLGRRHRVFTPAEIRAYNLGNLMFWVLFALFIAVLTPTLMIPFIYLLTSF